MTTTVYLVAYPHPEVPPPSRLLWVRLDSDADGNTVLERLRDAYSGQRDYLKGVTIWKASRSIAVKFLP